MGKKDGKYIHNIGNGAFFWSDNSSFNGKF